MKGNYPGLMPTGDTLSANTISGVELNWTNASADLRHVARLAKYAHSSKAWFSLAGQ